MIALRCRAMCAPSPDNLGKESDMTYTPQHLERWTRPDSFMQHCDDWFYSSKCYVFISQHRDSDSVTRSNFACALNELGGESDTVKVISESHWAVGWVEWIAIHASDSIALEKADEIACALSGYPILNEDHWSELEWTEACEYWESMTVESRMEYCQRAGVSIFAARHDCMPYDESGMLQEILNGC
jgi:hypothetical protein